VTTIDGPYVFLRRQKSDGSGGFAQTPLTCRDVHEDAVRYQRLGPAFIRLWLPAMESQARWLWPSVAERRGAQKRYRFRTDDPAMKVRLSITCTSDTSCVTRGGGLNTRTTDAPADQLTRLLQLAPSPPGGNG
jgi:hypothetical protein